MTGMTGSTRHYSVVLSKEREKKRVCIVKNSIMTHPSYPSQPVMIVFILVITLRVIILIRIGV